MPLREIDSIVKSVTSNFNFDKVGDLSKREFEKILTASICASLDSKLFSESVLQIVNDDSARKMRLSNS